jgi:hypothetical protein
MKTPTRYMLRESGTSLLFFFLKSIRVSTNRITANAAQRNWGGLRFFAKKKVFHSNCVRRVGHLQIDGRLAYLVEMTNTYPIKQFLLCCRV